MTESPTHRFHFSLESEKGKQLVKGEISGHAELPSLEDLKCNAIIALLNSIDKKNFREAEKDHLIDQHIKEIEETIKEIKIHDQFQGTTPNLDGA